MKIVGLTGGIACGKSTVSACLRDTHGLPLVDADAIAKAALDVGAPAYHKVIVAFGDRILEPEGAPAGPSSDAAGAVCVPTAGRPIDRKKLGEIVFNDAAQRRRLAQYAGPDAQHCSATTRRCNGINAITHKQIHAIDSLVGTISMDNLEMPDTASMCYHDAEVWLERHSRA